jgi:hypothetical protein
VCLAWNDKSSPFEAALVNRSSCLVVFERGVCLCIMLCLCASDLKLVYL